MKYLLVGLGNIGAAYAHTRHNIGFDVVDALAQKHGLSFVVDRLAETAELSLRGRKITIIKPTTYMNLSGKSVQYWLEKTGTPLEHLLVVVDELAIPVEALRLRAKGSAAGHNGLKSIEESLQTQAYARLRFGIGSDFAKGRQADFVLSKWKPDEQVLVKLKIEHCVAALEQWPMIGIEKLVATVNNFKLP
jgi:peptidyl-tRNA hydrolase, PTH1 family